MDECSKQVFSFFFKSNLMLESPLSPLSFVLFEKSEQRLECREQLWTCKFMSTQTTPR